MRAGHVLIRSSRARYRFAGTQLRVDATLVTMAQRRCEGIGRIRRGLAIEFQYLNNHVLHLLFGCSPGSHNRLFDFTWRVLEYLGPMFESRTECR